jgi:hypothetical protein
VPGIVTTNCEKELAPMMVGRRINGKGRGSPGLMLRDRRPRPCRGPQEAKALARQTAKATAEIGENVGRNLGSRVLLI